MIYKSCQNSNILIDIKLYIYLFCLCSVSIHPMSEFDTRFFMTTPAPKNLLWDGLEIMLTLHTSNDKEVLYFLKRFDKFHWVIHPEHAGHREPPG